MIPPSFQHVLGSWRCTPSHFCAGLLRAPLAALRREVKRMDERQRRAATKARVKAEAYRRAPQTMPFRVEGMVWAFLMFQGFSYNTMRRQFSTGSSLLFSSAGIWAADNTMERHVLPSQHDRYCRPLSVPERCASTPPVPSDRARSRYAFPVWTAPREPDEPAEVLDTQHTVDHGMVRARVVDSTCQFVGKHDC